LQHRSAVVIGSPLTRVLVVLVESGLMYTTSIIILFGLYMASNNGQYGVSDAVSGVPICHVGILKLISPVIVTGCPNHREQLSVFDSAVLLLKLFGPLLGYNVQLDYHKCGSWRLIPIHHAFPLTHQPSSLPGKCPITHDQYSNNRRPISGSNYNKVAD